MRQMHGLNRFKDWLSCAYCGRVLAWKWKGTSDFNKHRIVDGACPCKPYLDDSLPKSTAMWHIDQVDIDAARAFNDEYFR